MRGLLLFVVFFALLTQVFKRPYVGILMWFWVSLMNPHRIVWGFAGNLNYALIVAVVTFFSLFLHPDEPKFPPRDRTTVLMILLMIWISLTSVGGIGPPDEILTMWSQSEKMLLMTLLAYAMTNTRERFDQLVLVCVLSIAFFGLRGGLFTLAHGGAFRVYGPRGSMIGDNNDLGVALTMMLPLLFYLRQRYSQPYLKWPMLVLIGLTIIGDLFTYSRGALVAISVMSAVFWLRTRQKIAMGALIAVAAWGVLQYAPPEWFGRMHTIETYKQDASAESRLYLWQLSWAMTLKHPILGAGFHWGFDPEATNRELWNSGLPRLIRPRAPHSNWLEMSSTHGFIGLALFIGFFVSSALDAQWLIRRTRRRRDLLWANNFGRMLQVALIGFGVGGTFASLDMYDGFYAVVLLGAVARRVVAAELAEEATAEAVRGQGLGVPAAAIAGRGGQFIRT